MSRSRAPFRPLGHSFWKCSESHPAHSTGQIAVTQPRSLEGPKVGPAAALASTPGVAAAGVSPNSSAPIPRRRETLPPVGGVASCVPPPQRPPGLNAAAAADRSSCLADAAPGSLPAPVPGPTAREAPPVGSVQRPRLRTVGQSQVSQGAWGCRGACGANPHQETPIPAATPSMRLPSPAAPFLPHVGARCILSKLNCLGTEAGRARTFP